MNRINMFVLADEPHSWLYVSIIRVMVTADFM